MLNIEEAYESKTETEFITVRLDKWMELHLKQLTLENERSNYQSKFWNSEAKVEELKKKVAVLEAEVEKLRPHKEFREINLIDIARKNSEVLEEEANE